MLFNIAIKPSNTMKKTRFSQYDLLEITAGNKTFTGLLVNKIEKEGIVLKLSSGYNIFVKNSDIKSIKLIKKSAAAKKSIAKKVSASSSLPTISILHTGGTVASKADYKTGAVSSRFSPSELLEMFPELRKIANIKSSLVFQMFSEDLEPEHWQILAKSIASEIKKGIKGIIITHGTDTMAYTAAALSFMIQNPPIPIILTGSQRSSDRPSTDSALNLICATQFIAKSNFKGIAICMHATEEDKACLIHQGTKAKKMHTSRRDTFRSINVLPIAEVRPNGNVVFLRSDYQRDGKLKIDTKFEKKIAIVKMRPGFNPKELSAYNNYKGLIIEGTGLGHAPINSLDKYTKHHKELLSKLSILSKKMPVIITSQSPYGRTNLNVYSTGRDLQSAGVISGLDMLTETAYVKLGWLLGNIKDVEKVKKEMQANLIGEISEVIEERAFLY